MQINTRPGHGNKPQPPIYRKRGPNKWVILALILLSFGAVMGAAILRVEYYQTVRCTADYCEADR